MPSSWFIHKAHPLASTRSTAREGAPRRGRSPRWRALLCLPILFALLLYTPCLSIGAHASEFLVYEQFDHYELGTAPPDFIFYGNGSGAIDQVVSDAHSRSGYNSFRIEGQSGSPVLIFQQFVMPDNEISLSASLFSERIPSPNSSLGAGSVNVAFGLSVLGDPALYVGMVLGDDGTMYLMYGDESRALMSYQPSKWYECEFFYNASARSVSPWVNGNLIDTYYLDGAVPSPDSIVIVGGESGSVNYLDDLYLWSEGGTPIIPEPSDGAAPSTVGSYFPAMLMAAVVLGAGIPGFFLLRLFTSTRTVVKGRLRIEEVLKAVGMVAPIMAIGIGALWANSAFGSSNSELFICIGVFIVAFSITVVAYLTYKWRLVDGQ
jgi:hypothetical protein